jgi:hypothetical protein
MMDQTQVELSHASVTDWNFITVTRFRFALPSPVAKQQAAMREFHSTLL